VNDFSGGHDCDGISNIGLPFDRPATEHRSTLFEGSSTAIAAFLERA